MADERRLAELMTEMERVGMDAHAFPAGFAVRDEDAMKVLRALEDGAGPNAFLSRIREQQEKDRLV